MGVWNDSKLIFGWKVDTDKFIEYLKKNNMDCCGNGERNYCLCGGWINWDKPFHVICCSPYFDCDYKYYNIYITLTEKESITLTEVNELSSLIKEAKEFVEEINEKEQQPPQLFSAAHVC